MLQYFYASTDTIANTCQFNRTLSTLLEKMNTSNKTPREDQFWNESKPMLWTTFQINSTEPLGERDTKSEELPYLKNT